MILKLAAEDFSNNFGLSLYDNNNLQNEWKLVALIVDRVLFWLFSILTIVSSVILLLVLPILKNRELIKPYSNSKE